ncbi:unnamed protein product [Durusdinium trenchii]|uniref:Uncharacterized protein n=1 Tax=Durusdinium trenchii TaxID=1381693 RepID=A0ABP0PND9_9DINO
MRPNGSSLCVPNGHMSPCELASPSFSAYSGIAFIHLQTPLPSLPSKTTKHANIQPPPARFSGVSPCIADGRLSVCGSSIRINPSPCIAAMGCCGNKAKVQEPSKDSKVETPAEADTNPSGGAEPTDDPSAKAGGEEWVEEMVGIDKEATIQMLVCIDWMETSGRTPEPLPSLSDTALRNAKAVRIPEHVVTLGSWAFDRCLRMILVEIPNSVTSIQNEAFSNCKSLAKVVIPDSVAYIGRGAFCHCCSLASVILSESLTGIERNTFEGCESLVELAIPSSVMQIHPEAFTGCRSLADMPSIQPASEMPGGYRRSEKSEENRFAWIGSHVLGLDLLALRRSGSLSDPTRERMERCCVAMGAIDQNQSTNQSARVFV